MLSSNHSYQIRTINENKLLMTKTVFLCPSVCILFFQFLSCDLVSKTFNVAEEQDLGQNDSSVNVFVFPASKPEKISQTASIDGFFVIMFEKTSNVSHRYLYSIKHPSKIWEHSFCSPKKTWVLKFQSLVSSLAVLISLRNKEIRLVRIDGVVRTYTQHFRQTFGTGCSQTVP